jgi:hypothetical protein
VGTPSSPSRRETVTKNKKLAVYVRPELKEVLDVASRDSGVPISRICNLALEELLPPDLITRVPPFEIRKQLREATLAIGRRCLGTKSKDKFVQPADAVTVVKKSTR